MHGAERVSGDARLPARIGERPASGRAALSPVALLATLAMLLFAVPAGAPQAAAGERIGTTVVARGAAAAFLERDIRLIGHGTPIYERDVLTTGRDSFAIVVLDDGTKMSLRPGTVFRIDEYADEAGEERMRFNLFRGGVRTVTGAVAERAPDAFELRTPVATIGLLGTDFTARLCERDCVEEAEALGEDAGGGPDVVGRIAFVKGEATAVSLFGRQRALVAGGPVFQGDTLETGSDAFAVIAFRDESRITLLENTQFRISRHEYDAGAPERAGALMRLLRGGIRAVAGLISRARPESWEIATPVATISTRGTRFDVVCVGVCAQDGHSSFDPASLAPRTPGRTCAGRSARWPDSQRLGPGRHGRSVRRGPQWRGGVAVPGRNVRVRRRHRRLHPLDRGAAPDRRSPAAGGTVVHPAGPRTRRGGDPRRPAPRRLTPGGGGRSRGGGPRGQRDRDLERGCGHDDLAERRRCGPAGWR